jgi:hypothetical protein
VLPGKNHQSVSLPPLSAKLPLSFRSRLKPYHPARSVPLFPSLNHSAVPAASALDPAARSRCSLEVVHLSGVPLPPPGCAAVPAAPPESTTPFTTNHCPTILPRLKFLAKRLAMSNARPDRLGPKRLKIAIACDSCRTSKKKCDGARPGRQARFTNAQTGIPKN